MGVATIPESLAGESPPVATTNETPGLGGGGTQSLLASDQIDVE